MITMTRIAQATQQGPGLVDVVKDLATLESTSAKIRYLTTLGWKTSRIAQMLGIKYQHARNVQVTPLKKQPGTAWTESQIKAATYMAWRFDELALSETDLEYFGTDDYAPMM